MAIEQRKGLLEGIHLRLEKSAGEEFRKRVDNMKAILDSIGTIPLNDSKQR